jgi:hypothetical protein
MCQRQQHQQQQRRDAQQQRRRTERAIALHAPARTRHPERGKENRSVPPPVQSASTPVTAARRTAVLHRRTHEEKERQRRDGDGEADRKGKEGRPAGTHTRWAEEKDTAPRMSILTTSPPFSGAHARPTSQPAKRRATAAAHAGRHQHTRTHTHTHTPHACLPSFSPACPSLVVPCVRCVCRSPSLSFPFVP